MTQLVLFCLQRRETTLGVAELLARLVLLALLVLDLQKDRGMD